MADWSMSLPDWASLRGISLADWAKFKTWMQSTSSFFDAGIYMTSPRSGPLYWEQFKGGKQVPKEIKLVGVSEVKPSEV